MKVLIIVACFALYMALGFGFYKYLYPKPRRRRNVWWLRLKDRRLVFLNRWRFFIKPDLKRFIRKVKGDA
jgi:hypothetical protein